MFKWLRNLFASLFSANRNKQIELPRPSAKRIVCPRCLESIVFSGDLVACTNCAYELPPRYKKFYREAPPIYIQVFGWSSHGKTMFLDVLRLLLIETDFIYKLWGDYAHSALTQLDLEHENTLRMDRRNGQAPGSTPKRDRDQNEVYIMHMAEMERWGDRMMVIMDHAGEQFETMDGVPAGEIPYLLNTPTTFMLISIPDIKRSLQSGQAQAGTSMDQLLQIYLETMERNGVDLGKNRRNMVIVLTKADMIDNLPLSLENYLTNDEVYNAFQSPGRGNELSGMNLVEYIERMGNVSEEISSWLQSDPSAAPGGDAFVRQIKRNNINAKYTIISSTGQDIDSVQGVQLMPRRVLDPFFWALEYQSR